MKSPMHSDKVVSQLENTSHDEDEEDDEEETFQYKDEPSSPSKRLNVGLMPTFKNSSINNHDEFKIELVQAGFEVISLENKDGYDGFVNPIRQAIENNDSVARELSLICMATRCKSPNKPEPLYNPPSQTTTINNTPKSYPRQVIIRAVRRSNTTSRKKALADLARFCNDYNKNHPPKTMTRERWQKLIASTNEERYVISDDFDKTPPLSNLRKLGNIIVPGHVINLIFRTFDNVDGNWASTNPSAAKKFFSTPYPMDAITTLGYSPHVEEEDPDNVHYPTKKRSKVIT
jgi:hypothetical protein